MIKKLISLGLSVCLAMNVSGFAIAANEETISNNIHIVQENRAMDHIKIALTTVALGTIPGAIGDLATAIFHHTKNKIKAHSNKKYLGFNSLKQSKKQLDKVANGASELKIYGQEKAKKQCMPIIMESMYNIHRMKNGAELAREKPGHVVCMIGPSGVGKTTMAKAIAKAILNHPEKTCTLLDTSAINRNGFLGEQLFRTVAVKNVGRAEREKDLYDYNNGINTRGEESLILDHILSYYESVVIIDDYDKMKKMTAASQRRYGYDDEAIGDNGEDKTADEILKSIADTGKYRVAGTEVD